MKRLFAGVIVVVCAVIGATLFIVAPKNNTAEYDAVKNENSENTETPAPDFTLEDLSGAIHTRADYSGTPLVINVWATWCPFCVNELPDFVALQNEYGDQIQVIAINRGESKDRAIEYLRELQIDDDLLYLFDPTDSYYRAIGAFSMPETIFVDADGNIATHTRGPIALEEMRALVEEAF